MKLRKGFVSNSSSSSFICDICGETFSGMDASRTDFDLGECKNRHLFCIEHLKDNETEEDKWDDKIYLHCPICDFEEVHVEDVFRYLLKKNNLDKNLLLKELKEKFETYDNFKKYMGEV